MWKLRVDEQLVGIVLHSIISKVSMQQHSQGTLKFKILWIPNCWKIPFQTSKLISCWLTHAYCFFHQAEERLTMVEEKRLLTEEKRKAEEGMKKQEKWAQEVILNKTKSARPKLSFGFRSKDGF